MRDTEMRLILQQLLFFFMSFQHGFCNVTSLDINELLIFHGWIICSIGCYLCPTIFFCDVRDVVDALKQELELRIEEKQTVFDYIINLANLNKVAGLSIY